VDPVRAEIIVSMKFPGGLELPSHYHTGIVVGHTVTGAWRYKENNWISRAGDTVYEVAGSSHTPESLEETVVFFYLVGELLFLAENKKILWQENRKTSIERYRSYCAANGITARDLTSWAA
jgi:2,4'-dihydroxyacetophenone dioxygenase